MRPPEPGRRNKYCEYVFTLHRKLHRRRMKYNLFKMLAFLNIHLCELSSNFILAPEVSDTGKLHIHAIVQIDEDTARFKIFKRKYQEIFGLMLDSIPIKEKGRISQIKTYVTNDNFLSRFIYIRKDSNETINRIFEIQVPDHFKLLNQDTLGKFLLFYIKSKRRQSQLKKNLLKYPQIHNTVAISEKYGALHNFLHPCVSYIDRESEGGERRSVNVST